MDKKTLLYYEEKKEIYTNTTQSLNFSEIQDLFLSYLSPKAYILDLGCGSGRDTNYFLKKGFNVDAIDGSLAMCKIASKYCNIEVKNISFENISFINSYNGIWACASLLHVPFKDLDSILYKLNIALKESGILYMSFKLGTFEGYRDNRYYTDLNIQKLMQIISIQKYYNIIQTFETNDIRVDREDEKWFNIFLQKK